MHIGVLIQRNKITENNIQILSKDQLIRRQTQRNNIKKVQKIIDINYRNILRRILLKGY